MAVNSIGMVYVFLYLSLNYNAAHNPPSVPEKLLRCNLGNKS